MRRRILTLTIGALLFAHVPGRAQGIAYEVFGAYLDSLREQAGIPGLAVAIVNRERIVWDRAYGHQDLGRALPARTDTPFNVDGLTQVFTAAMVLRCAEERRLSLNDRVGDFRVETRDRDVTIQQLLTHTSGTSENLRFAYRPERLAPLWPIVRACAGDSYRETFADVLTNLVMFDSVPGPNIINVAPPEEGVPSRTEVARYTSALERRALPYAVDSRGRVFAGSYPASAAVLTPSNGLVTTVRDLAKFDLALRQGEFFKFPETLEEAWSAPADASGGPLPHALGWFVQRYKGEKVVWQFGVGEDASSSLMITLPARGLTLIMMANSDRLVKPYSLDDGDVSLSPFARLFLSVFVR